MKRILFVSRQFPSDISKSVHGVYMRMRLFLNALMEVSEALDVLFYVEPGVDSSVEAMRRAETDIWAAWCIRANITLCPVEEPASGSESLWDHYVRPTFSLFAQSLYAGTSAAVQVGAFEAALERHPDAVFVHRLDAMCQVLLTRRSCPPVFFDLDDIEHIRWVRHLRQGPSWPGKRLYYLQLPALVAGERQETPTR